jgi:hypothetical protein
MTRRIITIRIEVDTNLDPSTLEERIVNFLDPARLATELLGKERVRFRNTEVDVESPAEVEPDSERTQRADHELEMAKDRRERGES